MKMNFIDFILLFIVIIICNNQLNSSCDKNSSQGNEKPIVIITTSFNNEKYYKKNLDSTLNQKYENYRIIYVDDASTDNTVELVEKYVQERCKTDKVTLVKNKINLGGMTNIVHSVYKCKDNEIIVNVDGDDCLAHENVLRDINKIYQEDEVWITYGNTSGTNLNC